MFDKNKTVNLHYHSHRGIKNLVICKQLTKYDIVIHLICLKSMLVHKIAPRYKTGEVMLLAK